MLQRCTAELGRASSLSSFWTSSRVVILTSSFNNSPSHRILSRLPYSIYCIFKFFSRGLLLPHYCTFLEDDGQSGAFFNIPYFTRSAPQPAAVLAQGVSWPLPTAPTALDSDYGKEAAATDVDVEVPEVGSAGKETLMAVGAPAAGWAAVTPTETVMKGQSQAQSRRSKLRLWSSHPN